VIKPTAGGVNPETASNTDPVALASQIIIKYLEFSWTFQVSKIHGVGYIRG
jgi:hypothetical protein